MEKDMKKPNSKMEAVMRLKQLAEQLMKDDFAKGTKPKLMAMKVETVKPAIAVSAEHPDAKPSLVKHLMEQGGHDEDSGSLEDSLDEALEDPKEEAEETPEEEAAEENHEDDVHAAPGLPQSTKMAEMDKLKKLLKK